MKHDFGDRGPVTIEIARCQVCGAIDHDGRRADEECPGPRERCPGCGNDLDEFGFCSVCGHQKHGTGLAA